MYSYEIDKILSDRCYYYESFYNFEIEVRSTSPQLYFNILEEKDECIILNVWTADNYNWKVYIGKNKS